MALVTTLTKRREWGHVTKNKTKKKQRTQKYTSFLRLRSPFFFYFSRKYFHRHVFFSSLCIYVAQYHVVGTKRKGQNYERVKVDWTGHKPDFSFTLIPVSLCSIKRTQDVVDASPIVLWLFSCLDIHCLPTPTSKRSSAYHETRSGKVLHILSQAFILLNLNEFLFKLFSLISKNLF